MKKVLLVLFSAIFILPVFSQNVYNGSLTNADGFFDRPDEGIPPVTISVIGTHVHYDVIPLNVTTAGLVTITCSSTWDNFSILYSTAGFNPLAPLTNALEANDDYLLGPNSGFDYNFTAPGIYYLVICSFKNDVTGSYVITTSAPIVLPLRLISFTAANESSKSNIIKWSSENESNLNAYQVQRSVDVKHFYDLTNGSILAGNNTSRASYHFTDNEPAKKYNYYRLKITERSGRISYSPVVLVKNSNTAVAGLTIFPNPAFDYLQIEMKSMQNMKAVVSIVDASGAIMENKQYYFNNQSVLSVDVKNLPAGKYFLRTIINNDESTTVFIKR